MKDYLFNILSKLVKSIEGVDNEVEMLIRLAIGVGLIACVAIFKKQISKAFVWLCTKTIARRSKNAQKALVDCLTKPLAYFLLVLSIFVASEVIAPGGAVRNPFLAILKLGVIFCTAWFAIGFISSDFSFFLNGDDDSKTKKTAVTFISNVLKAVVLIVALLLVLEQFGISATRIFAALGLGGVAIAFACKDAVENMLSGFIIIYDKPFEVDDAIQIDGEVGTVEDVKIRTTRLRMVDGSQKIYPNTTIANSALINLSRMEKRSFEETLCIDYKHSGDEAKAFCEGIKALLSKKEHILQNDVRVNFLHFGESALEISLFFYVDILDVPSYQAFKSELNTELKNYADDSNIDLAFNSQSLYFANELKINK